VGRAAASAGGTPDTTTTAPAPPAVPSDLRRLLVFRAHGAVRLLLGCRARMEDIEGAVAAGQRETAVLMAYELVQLSLSVRGLRTVGELTYGRDEAAFDPFAGVPDEEVRAGLRLAADGGDAVGERAEPWLARLRAHVQETEAQLDYAEPLPDVRSGSGMIKGFKLARTWEPLLREASLPDLLPDAWKRRAD
uniref:hypothetical protein n=1 Tax=Streptomyces otsuchiensis TaxID=2681388 RepID=UPI001D130C92